MPGESAKNALRRMYWNTPRISYPGRVSVDIRKSITAGKSAGAECIACDREIKKDERVLAGEARVGGRVIGKTVKVEACLECARLLRDVIDERIKESAT